MMVIFKKYFVWIRYFSLFGITLALYLLWQQISRPTFQICNINSTINCDAIISGEVAKTFGISTPLIGLVGYIVIFFSAIFKNKRMVLYMSLFGLIFCLYIGFIEIFRLGVICPVCILCQLTMLSVFTFSVLANKKVDNV
jgi:uncharacterized membrane protein